MELESHHPTFALILVVQILSVCCKDNGEKDPCGR